MRTEARPGPSGNSSSRGFSLLEMLIATGISVVIITAIAAMFQGTSENQRELEKISRTMENVRFAMDSIASEIRHAGYYGEFNPADINPVYADLAPCATTLTQMGWELAAIGQPSLPTAVRGDTAIHSCLADQSQSHTQSISFSRVDTGGMLSLEARTPGNFYLHPTRCEEDMASIEVLDAAGAAALRDGECASVFPGVRRLVQRTYYLSDCNDCEAGDGIQTLKRAEYVDGSFQVTSVAENIERLAVEYGMDSDADGQPDAWVRANEVDGSAAHLSWRRAVAARVTLLGRADEPTRNFVDQTTYTIAGTAYAPADAFKRALLTQTVRLSNVAGRLEN